MKRKYRFSLLSYGLNNQILIYRTLRPDLQGELPEGFRVKLRLPPLSSSDPFLAPQAGQPDEERPGEDLTPSTEIQGKSFLSHHMSCNRHA